MANDVPTFTLEKMVDSLKSISPSITSMYKSLLPEKGINMEAATELREHLFKKGCERFTAVRDGCAGLEPHHFKEGYSRFTELCRGYLDAGDVGYSEQLKEGYAKLVEHCGGYLDPASIKEGCERFAELCESCLESNTELVAYSFAAAVMTVIVVDMSLEDGIFERINSASRKEAVKNNSYPIRH